MRWTFLSMLVIAACLVACGGSDKKEMNSQADSSTPLGDAGKGDADAATSPRTDAAPTPRDCDIAATPGNDCDDAVGCRNALECGLDAKSCCVPGLDASGVSCFDGVACPPDSGRANCDGPEDCTGGSCCVDIVAGKTECLDTCDGKVALCHTDEDCVEPKTCSQGKTFTWWGLCG